MGNLGSRGNLGLFSFSLSKGLQVQNSIHGSTGIEIYAFGSSLSGVGDY